MALHGAAVITADSAACPKPNNGPSSATVANGAKGTAWGPPSEAPTGSLFADIAMSRCSGTNRSSAAQVLLPVPRMPTTCQVSSNRISEAGTTHINGSTFSPESSTTATATAAQAAWSEPDA